MTGLFVLILKPDKKGKNLCRNFRPNFSKWKIRMDAQLPAGSSLMHQIMQFKTPGFG